MKTIVIIMVLIFPGLILADLSESDFKILNKEVSNVGRANANIAGLLYNEKLTEEQFNILKDNVQKLKGAVNKMEEVIQKTQKKTFENLLDNNWYWDVNKNLYWMQLPDGRIETKPVPQKTELIKHFNLKLSEQNIRLNKYAEKLVEEAREKERKKIIEFVETIVLDDGNDFQEINPKTKVGTFRQYLSQKQ